MSKNILCHVVISDVHIPFHNQSYVNTFFNFCKDLKPDYIHILGDLCDAYPLSKFLKNPERLLSFPQELYLARRFIHHLRKLHPKSKIFFSEGNHEERLKKFIWNKVPELSQMSELSWTTLLDLDKHKVKLFPYNKPYEIINGDYPIVFSHGHDLRKYPGMSARTQAEKFGKTIVVGHSHCMSVQPVSFVNQQIYGIENGCLADITQLEYTTYVQWQFGWTVLWHWKKGVEVEQIYLTDHGYCYRGKFKPLCDHHKTKNCTSSQSALITQTS